MKPFYRGCEYAYLVFLGLAILGATNDYSLAAGVLPVAWTFWDKNRDIDSK
jgi:hypothetical protein